jgi:hypothetical protein
LKALHDSTSFAVVDVPDAPNRKPVEARDPSLARVRLGASSALNALCQLRASTFVDAAAPGTALFAVGLAAAVLPA